MIRRIQTTLFLLFVTISFLNGQNTLQVIINGSQAGDEVKVIAQRGVQDYYEAIVTDANSETANFSDLAEGQWAIKLDAKGYIYDPTQLVDIPDQGSIVFDIEKFEDGDYTYEWNDDSSDGGHPQQAFINEPVKIIYLEDTIAIPENFTSHELARTYGVILDDSELAWSDETSFKLLSNIGRLPFSEKQWNAAIGTGYKYIVKLTDDYLEDDVEITGTGDVKEIRISNSAFTYAAPQTVIIDELRGTFFSKRLYEVCLRIYTSNGTNTSAVAIVAQQRFGITFLIPSDELFEIFQEDIANFQAFSSSEKLQILTMLEELPSGMHSQVGLQYMARRINGQPHPTHPDAAAIAWTSLYAIEFMETAFTVQSIEYMQRLILHEKTHFLWEYTFDQETKDDWIEVGEWYEDPASESGWSTTNETEFVSPYAHALNPNEDMAESVAYYVQNPDMLKSVSIDKYDFIKNRIMHGTYYEAIIQEDLTFEVLNLFPDYYYPGRIIGSKVEVLGAADEDKTVSIELKLKTFDVAKDGATKAVLRFHSTVGTHIDIWMKAQNNGTDSILTVTKTLSKHLKSGHWFLSTIKVYDQANNIRFGNAATVGMNLFLNNELEDFTPPVYQDSSTVMTPVVDKFRYRSGAIYENGDFYQAMKIEMAYYDESPISRMLARVNFDIEDNSVGSPFSEDAQVNNFEDDYNSVKNGTVHFPIPEYYPTGLYSIVFSYAEDVAANSSRCYYVEDESAFDNNDYDIFEDERIEFEVTTANPDYLAPIMDLNNMAIQATPTNPEAPNGETIVELQVTIRDTSDHSGLESGIRRIFYTLKNPQGQEFNYSADDQLNELTLNFIHLLKSPITPGAWTTFNLSTLLPVGSALGTWGLSSMQLVDRANNIKNYSFVEIVQFDLLEADYTFTTDPSANVNENNYVTALNESNSSVNVYCEPCDDINFNYRIHSEYGGTILTGTGVMTNDTGQVSGIDLSEYPVGKLYLQVEYTNELNQLIAVVNESLEKNKLSLNIRAYLESALNSNNNETNSNGDPLMRDDLRHSPYTDLNYIPIQDPHTISATPFFDLPSEYDKSGPHLLEGNLDILDPDQVFGVSGENAIVDWIFVELRSKDNYHIAIASRSGLLQRDGDIVDVDGVSPLQFQGVLADSFYVVVDHRLHLSVMSQKVAALSDIDFTSPDFETFDFGTSVNEDYDYSGIQMQTMPSGVKALWGGDLDCDGKIKFSSPDDDLNVIFFEVLFSSPNFSINYNGADGYYQGDFNMDSKVKFTNPNDDANPLLARVLFYPLNATFKSNFDFLIEQVPVKTE